MILGIFLIRPIPPPAQENSDFDVSQGRQEDTVSSDPEPHDSSHTPLLDYDFAEGVYSNSVHNIAVNNSESYAMDDVPSHRDEEDAIALLSAQRRGFDRGETMIFDRKPNLHGKKLWISGDFWLLFTILAIRKSSFVFFILKLTLSLHVIVSGTGLMCTYPQYNPVPGGLSDRKIIDMNNVGTISQILYAHQNSEYDKVKASGWQAAQVSLLSLMSFLGRLSIGR